MTQGQTALCAGCPGAMRKRQAIMGIRTGLPRLIRQGLRRLSGRHRYGYLDQFDAHRIAGWAQDPRAPGQPALLTLYVDGRPEMTLLADIARDDVVAAGLGPRHCGFDTSAPPRLRDGQPHEMVLRLGSDGPVLKRLRLRGADGAGAFDLAQAPEDGVAYLDSSGAITGWATGCMAVQIRFDAGPVQQVALDRPVPGFGNAGLQGFRLPVPPDLRDGRAHAAHVFFDRRPGAAARLLDGAPVAFRLGKGQARVEVMQMQGLELRLRLRAGSAAVGESPAPPRVQADGADLPLRSQGGGVFALTLPGPCHLNVTTPEGTALASYDIRGGQITHDTAAALPEGALSDAMLARARACLADFIAAPDARFDPIWYRWAHPDTALLSDPAALIAHYGSNGVQAGYAPGPLFDERAARLAYPAVAAAIAAGDLPCAFALDLALEDASGEATVSGTLDTLQSLSRPQAQALLRAARAPGGDADRPAGVAPVRQAPRNLPAAPALPPPSFAQPASASIYAAWLARLDLSEAARAEIVHDEQAQRARVLATTLTRAPLVSIIMPSWNRAFTIGEAIQSVLEQSYQNWELIICDDASEDRTADVVGGFRDPRIRYMKFLKSNGAGARNKGLAHARGDYIAYLDSDNIWHPLFLDMMLRTLAASPGRPMAYSAYLDTEIRGAQVYLDRIARPPFRPTALSSRNFIDLNTIVHHRALYDMMGGFDTGLVRLQDWDLVLRYTSIFRPVFVNHPGVFYRRNIAWGQVTHLFMGAGAQDTVNAKTRRRLEERHERLTLPWPLRSRITLLCGDAEGPDQAVGAQGQGPLARSLVALAAPFVDIDLVLLGGAAQRSIEQAGLDQNRPEGPEGPEGNVTRNVTLHRVPADLCRRPEQLVAALGGLVQGRPVLSLGPERAWLETWRGLDARLVWLLRTSGAGSCLQSLARPAMEFDLGALPLAWPRTQAARPLHLVLGPAQARAAYHAAQSRTGPDLLLPPDADGRPWRLVTRGSVQDLPPDLPRDLGRVTLSLALAPVAGLAPFEQALLGAQMAAGVPVAIAPPATGAPEVGTQAQEGPVPGGLEDLAQDWIAANAAFALVNPRPDWIHEKTGKLLADTAAMTRLRTRAARVHAIVWHPDLVRERLAYALYRMLHDSPECEVRDGHI